MLPKIMLIDESDKAYKWRTIRVKFLFYEHIAWTILVKNCPDDLFSRVAIKKGIECYFDSIVSNIVLSTDTQAKPDMRE